MLPFFEDSQELGEIELAPISISGHQVEDSAHLNDEVDQEYSAYGSMPSHSNSLLAANEIKNTFANIKNSLSPNSLLTNPLCQQLFESLEDLEVKLLLEAQQGNEIYIQGTLTSLQKAVTEILAPNTDIWKVTYAINCFQDEVTRSTLNTKIKIAIFAFSLMLLVAAFSVGIAYAPVPTMLATLIAFAALIALMGRYCKNNHPSETIESVSDNRNINSVASSDKNVSTNLLLFFKQKAKHPERETFMVASSATP